jgi:hypothetical protein
MILRNGKFSGKILRKIFRTGKFSMENFPPHITTHDPSHGVLPSLPRQTSSLFSSAHVAVMSVFIQSLAVNGVTLFDAREEGLKWVVICFDLSTSYRTAKGFRFSRRRV